MARFDEYVESFLRRGGLTRRLALWQEVFGDENCRHFHYSRNALRKQDVVADFCGRFGISLEKNPAERANQSLSTFGVDLLRRINVLYGNKKRPKRIRRHMSSMFKGNCSSLLDRLPLLTREAIETEQQKMRHYLRPAQQAVSAND